MSPDAAFSHDSCVSAAPSLWRRGAHSPLSHLGFVLEHRLALKVVVPMHDLGAQHAQVARTFEISSMSAVANDVPVTPPEPHTGPTREAHPLPRRALRGCRADRRGSRADWRAESRCRNRVRARRRPRANTCARAPARSSASQPPELRSTGGAALGSRTMFHALAQRRATHKPVPGGESRSMRGRLRRRGGPAQ